jgi:hypothetical protein
MKAGLFVISLFDRHVSAVTIAGDRSVRKVRQGGGLKRQPKAWSAPTLALAAGLAIMFAMMIAAGYSRGFDNRISPNEWGRFVYALASALTKTVYGYDGYVILPPVKTTLQSGGLTNQPDILARAATSFPDNFHDKTLIDNAIKQASKLTIPGPTPELPNGPHNVKGIGGDDLGFVTFVTLSFSLFSHSVEAFYPTFLVIFGVSLFLFWCAFRNEPAYISILLLVCVVFYTLFVSPLFPGDPRILGPDTAWTTPATPHFLSTLAAVPLLHILAVSSRGLRPSLLQAACLVGQALILYFVIRIRFSAVWVLAPLLLVTTIAFLRLFRDNREQNGHFDFAALRTLSSWNLRAASTPLASLLARMPYWARRGWPAMVVLGTLLAAHIKFETEVHPIYRQGTYLRHHALWHELYYGLQQHPQWHSQHGEAHRINGDVWTGDQQPIAAILKYLDAHPEIDRRGLFDPEGSLYWGAIETYSRLVFFDFVRNNPRFVFETLVAKLRSLLTVLGATLGWTIGSLSVPGLALLLVSSLCAFWVMLSNLQSPSFRRYIAMLCMCAPLSWLPNLVAIVGWELMADAILFWLLLALVLPTYLAANLGCYSVKTIFPAVRARARHRP